MYSRNIPISNKYYIYIWRDILKKNVTIDFNYILEDSCFNIIIKIFFTSLFVDL